MKQLIIGFAGPAGCGKDTAGSILARKHGFQRLSFAKPLKDMLAAIGLPCPETADEKEAIIPWLGCSWRHLGQTLGTEWGREKVHPELWTLIAKQRMLVEGGNWVFTDVRFENESDMIRSMGGVVCHIQGRAHSMTAATKAHASERGLRVYAGDWSIENVGSMATLEVEVESLYRAMTR